MKFEIEVIKFNVADVITTSETPGGSGDEGGFMPAQ